jgi:hypothetical protein
MAPTTIKADELRKLADLKCQGTLTAQEFDTEKARLRQS